MAPWLRSADQVPAVKPGLHPRNRHARGYPFPRLVTACPELRPLLRRAPHGGATIDFADPVAVKTLNRALLAEAYGVRGWDIPPGYLCPPIPGRADYLHHLADLLAEGNRGTIPRGTAVRVLDVGVGANAIYPLIGHREYGWSFVGTEFDTTALASAARILAANPGLAQAIDLRRQARGRAIFAGVVGSGERFDLTLCNPPFHASLGAIREAAREKWRKLGHGASGNARDSNKRSTNSPAGPIGAAARPVQNFGGQAVEVWCEGGEVGFIRRMIEESASLGERVRWFTTLVSSSAALPVVRRALRQVGAREIRTVPMAQGQKRSRFVAWSFLSPEQAAAWQERWTSRARR